MRYAMSGLKEPVENGAVSSKCSGLINMHARLCLATDLHFVNENEPITHLKNLLTITQMRKCRAASDTYTLLADAQQMAETGAIA
jgi:hypothetical protein